MIPLVLLAGFLGAGKTRFLTDLVPALGTAGVRVRIVLNDFENARIDAARLGALDAVVTPLNGECVCCGSLRELLQTLYDVPSDPGSVMLIEANGATETDELLAHLTADPQLQHYTLPLQLTVVDAARWQKRWWHNALERAQVMTATHVHLNWTAKLQERRVQAVTESVRVVNPRAALASADRFALELCALAHQVQHDPSWGGRATAPLALPARARHAHPFGSAALDMPAIVPRSAFEHFIRTLPDQVVRAKGLVRFADDPGPMYVWHKVPGQSRVRLDPSWPHADATPTALFIGVELPVSDLAAQLRSLSAS